MSSQPWEADRPLTLGNVQAAIASNFPEIDGGSAEHLGSGFEFDVYTTGDGWVFRFRRRSEYQGLFDTESRAHRLVSNLLSGSVRVPRVEILGRPGAGFPYRFAGHRFIDGFPADSFEAAGAEGLASDLADALKAFHAVPADQAREAGLGELDPEAEQAKWAWLQEGLRYASKLPGLDPASGPALEWAGRVSLPPPSFAGPLRFVHHDLKPDHLIVGSRTRRLAGILDWPEARLGDPAVDFAGLVAGGGWGLAREVERRYDLPLGDGFWDRLRFHARLLAVIWLAAAEVQGSDLSRPTQWVLKAFNGEESGGNGGG